MLQSHYALNLLFSVYLTPILLHCVVLYYVEFGVVLWCVLSSHAMKECVYDIDKTEVLNIMCY